MFITLKLCFVLVSCNYVLQYYPVKQESLDWFSFNSHVVSIDKQLRRWEEEAKYAISIALTVTQGMGRAIFEWYISDNIGKIRKRICPKSVNAEYCSGLNSWRSELSRGDIPLFENQEWNLFTHLFHSSGQLLHIGEIPKDQRVSLDVI